jgi:hypothetical protein
MCCADPGIAGADIDTRHDIAADILQCNQDHGQPMKKLRQPAISGDRIGQSRQRISLCLTEP